MNIAYFDCFSGISGDMVLGALVDAGCDLAQLEAQLRRIPIGGWKISAEKVSRKGLAARRVHVECAEQHHHRSLSVILKLIQDAELIDGGSGPRFAAFSSGLEKLRLVFTVRQSKRYISTKSGPWTQLSISSVQP